MYQTMSAAFIFAGVLIASLSGLVRTFMPIPPMFAMICFLFGIILAFVGYMVIFIRINKLGLNWLIAPGRPGTINWFYIYKDGEVRITPSFRVGEGLLYAPQLEATIPDIKTYSLGDHKIRFVPEATGHACDTDIVQYVQVLKSKYGWANLRQARRGIFKGKEYVPTPAEEKLGIKEGYIKAYKEKVM